MLFFNDFTRVDGKQYSSEFLRKNTGNISIFLKNQRYLTFFQFFLLKNPESVIYFYNLDIMTLRKRFAWNRIFFTLCSLSHITNL